MPNLSLEVGKTYLDANQQSVTIQKVIPFDWQEVVSKTSTVQSMFYLGDNATLYTVIGQGIPRHSLDQTFVLVYDLVEEVTTTGSIHSHTLPIRDENMISGLNVQLLDTSQLITELKVKLGASGLNLTVTIT